MYFKFFQQICGVKEPSKTYGAMVRRCPNYYTKAPGKMQKEYGPPKGRILNYSCTAVLLTLHLAVQTPTTW